MSRKHRHNPLRLEALAARDVPASLDMATGVLTVNGDGNVNVISIDHNGTEIHVRQSNVDNGDLQEFQIAEVRSIVVNGYAKDDRVNVVRLPVNVPTTINLGEGNDEASVGDSTLDLNWVKSPVAVRGDAGDDTVFAHDQFRIASDTYTLGTRTIDRVGFGGLTHFAEKVILNAQQGGNVFRLPDIALFGTTVTIDANGGTDTIVGPVATNNTWTLAGTGAGSVSNVNFRDVERLSGGWRNDTFNFSVGGFDFASVDGGLGVDRVAYANYPSAVTVDLSAGTATRVAPGGLWDVENATGSGKSDTLRGDADHNSLDGLDGNDTLDGGAGDDVMFGRAGTDTMAGQAGNDLMFGGTEADVMSGGDDRDILFGGAGTDALDGGAGDDILGSGTTSYETDPMGLTGLMAIRNEWTSGRGYVERVLNIRGDNSPTPTTGVNGTYFLETHGPTPTVTHPNGAEDSLIGGTGDDWFFGHADEYDVDAWGDREAGERVNA